MWAHVVVALLAVWLMAAPSLLGFTGTPAEAVHRILGPLVGTFAIMAWWQVLRALRWVNVVAGALLVVAPLVGGHPLAAVLSSVLSGLAVAGLSLVRGRLDTDYGGGWRALRS